MCLLNPGSGKSDTILANIKLGVVDPDEHVPQDPEGTHLGIKTHEPTYTHSLATSIFLCVCVCVCVCVCLCLYNEIWLWLMQHQTSNSRLQNFIAFIKIVFTYIAGCLF